MTDEQSEELAKSLNVDYFLYEKISRTEEQPGILEQIRSRMCDMDTAYILFTSGSTGMPKGTIVSDRELISYIRI